MTNERILDLRGGGDVVDAQIEKVLVDGASYNCYANKPGLREAIRRTLEKAAAEPIDHLYSCMTKTRLFVEGFEEGVRRYKAALRQLMEPGKERE